MTQPLISICIPAYRWKTISDALNSIVKQFDWKIDDKIEIIVCDDDSPDWIKQIIQKNFLDKYNNIKYYKHEKNMGLQYNLAAATSFATWKYLWLLCDDDCLTSFSLKHTIEIIEKTNFDLLLANWHFSPSVEDIIKEWKNTYKEYVGIEPIIEYMYDKRNTYQDLVVYFQFYSIIVVKNSYRKESLSHFDKDFI
jgi:glycosyltransferase involved in cell wall biosynthesis